MLVTKKAPGLQQSCIADGQIVDNFNYMKILEKGAVLFSIH